MIECEASSRVLSCWDVGFLVPEILVILGVQAGRRVAEYVVEGGFASSGLTSHRTKYEPVPRQHLHGKQEDSPFQKAT